MYNPLLFELSTRQLEKCRMAAGVNLYNHNHNVPYPEPYMNPGASLNHKITLRGAGFFPPSKHEPSLHDVTLWTDLRPNNVIKVHAEFSLADARAPLPCPPPPFPFATQPRVAVLAVWREESGA